MKFDEGCGPLLHLTIRRGPSAGRTRVYCTCGWEYTYKSRRKAEKRGEEHVRVGNRIVVV